MLHCRNIKYLETDRLSSLRPPKRKKPTNSLIHFILYFSDHWQSAEADPTVMIRNGSNLLRYGHTGSKKSRWLSRAHNGKFFDSTIANKNLRWFSSVYNEKLRNIGISAHIDSGYVIIAYCPLICGIANFDVK